MGCNKPYWTPCPQHGTIPSCSFCQYYFFETGVTYTYKQPLSNYTKEELLEEIKRRMT